MTRFRCWRSRTAETLARWALHIAHRDSMLLVAESLAYQARLAAAEPVDDLPVEPMSDAELGAFMRAMGRDPETGGRL